jgi:hypothetical protein
MWRPGILWGDEKNRGMRETNAVAALLNGMATYDQKAEAKLSRTIVRVLRSGRARYGLSAGATVSACCDAMAVMASDAGVSDHQLGNWLHTIAGRIERGDKDFHGLFT